MIDKETVFILGAGASHPYGYPTGKGLRTYICDNFAGQFQRIFGRLQLKGHAAMLEAKADQFTKTFKNSSTPSIDLFLSRNKQFSDIGRLAIISSLLHFEHESKFREDIEEQDQDWYSYLYQRMTSSLIEPDGYKKFGNNQIIFITFNYDRSLEHFLYESLKNSFSEAGDDEIAAEFKKIPIYHIFGKIKALPWEDKFEGIDYVTRDKESPYDRFSFETLQKWSSNIRIVHEEIPSNLSHIIGNITNGKRVFFLGFGYAPENLEILKASGNQTMGQEIYGTALNFSDMEILRTEKKLVENLKSNGLSPRMKNMGCLELLREYL